MSLATRLIFKSTVLIFVLGACAGPMPKYEIDPDAVESEERVLSDTFQNVWRALQLAMAEYPIRTNNQDAGILESEYIKGDQGFRVPGQEQNGPVAGRRYRLKARVFKIAPNRTKVVIRKIVEKQKDFFSGPEKAPSDGLEELAIMYRIERELLIEQAAQKAQDNPNEELDIQ